MGTTKLTRKEILAEDPVHGSIVMLVEFFRTNKKIISIIVAVGIVLALGIYGVVIYLDKKNEQSQEILGKGIDYYHAEVNPESTDESNTNSFVISFRTDTEKYQAALKEFQSIMSDYGFTKASPVAQYYLGLTQLKMGHVTEAIENLQAVSNNSKKSSLGYLAGNVLAQIYEENGKHEEAIKILEGMIQDTAYELPKEELSLQMARNLKEEGKYEEAINVLQEGAAQGSSLSPLRDRLTAELERIKNEAQLKP